MPSRRSAIRKTPTLKDVAREAGVSIAAASYSLNGGGTIGEEVRARVQDVARRIGYRPNRSAQSVRTGRNTTLGLLLPDLRNPYFSALARAAAHSARQAGYTVVLIDTSGSMEDEVDGMRHLEDQGVAGAIWCQTSNQVMEATETFAMPVVVIGTPGLAFDNVTTKDTEGGQQLAEYLLSMGHEKIGVLSGASVHDSKDERTNGFIAALAGRAEVVWQMRTPFAVDPAPEVIDRLRQRDVSAVMCGNDMIAIAVLRAARQLGIKVPEDLSVVGFDDIRWASIVTPTLTTVNQPVDQMAAAALTLLLDRITDPERPIRRFKVDVRLVVRESVARPGPAADQAPMPGSQ